MDSVTRCPVNKPKVTEIIDEVAADICNHYCKYAAEYTDFEDLIKERCEDCPLNRL